MRKLALLLGSLVVVASAAAKEVVPAPVVVEEAPVQIVEKEVIVYRDKEEGFRPNGNVNVELKYFGEVEGQDRVDQGWTGFAGDRGTNRVRTEVVGTVNMTENQQLYFRTRHNNNIKTHGVEGRDESDTTQTRLRYFYNHGNLGDSKVNLTSAVWYQDSWDGTQDIQYQARFNFAEYMFNNDFIKTTNFVVAPRYKYKWASSNNDDYVSSLGFYVIINHDLPWGFSTELELDGLEYNFYGQDQRTGVKKGDTVDNDFSIDLGLHLYQDTNLYSNEKVSVDWHSALGYDTYNWHSEDVKGYGEEIYADYLDDNISSRYNDAEYEAYFSSDVTVSYQATEFVKVYALAGAEYRNWAEANENTATNWRWQPYVAAGFNVSF